MTARPPTMMIGVPASFSVAGIAATRADIAVPVSSTVVGSGFPDTALPDTAPRRGWSPVVEDLSAPAEVASEVQRDEQRVREWPMIVAPVGGVDPVGADHVDRSDPDRGCSRRPICGNAEQLQGPSRGQPDPARRSRADSPTAPRSGRRRVTAARVSVRAHPALSSTSSRPSRIASFSAPRPGPGNEAMFQPSGRQRSATRQNNSPTTGRDRSSSSPRSRKPASTAETELGPGRARAPTLVPRRGLGIEQHRAGSLHTDAPGQRILAAPWSEASSL